MRPIHIWMYSNLLEERDASILSVELQPPILYKMKRLHEKTARNTTHRRENLKSNIMRTIVLLIFTYPGQNKCTHSKYVMNRI